MLGPPPQEFTEACSRLPGLIVSPSLYGPGNRASQRPKILPQEKAIGTHIRLPRSLDIFTHTHTHTHAHTGLQKGKNSENSGWSFRRRGGSICSLSCGIWLPKVCSSWEQPAWQTRSRDELEKKRERQSGWLVFPSHRNAWESGVSPAGTCEPDRGCTQAAWKEWVGGADSRTIVFLPSRPSPKKPPRESAPGPNSESPVSVLGKSFLVSSDLAFLFGCKKTPHFQS